MIILDTNVVSEMIRPLPHPRVESWLAGLNGFDVFTTAVTMAEVLFGVRRLPDGRRRRQFAQAARAVFDDSFAGRILPFDEVAADAYAEIVTVRRGAGRPVSTPDAQIASIAAIRGADLATRNTRDFEHCGVRVVNPWDA